MRTLLLLLCVFGVSACVATPPCQTAGGYSQNRTVYMDNGKVGFVRGDWVYMDDGTIGKVR